jgi:hypothetical protein
MIYCYSPLLLLLPLLLHLQLQLLLFFFYQYSYPSLSLFFINKKLFRFLHSTYNSLQHFNASRLLTACVTVLQS